MNGVIPGWHSGRKQNIAFYEISFNVKKIKKNDWEEENIDIFFKFLG